jgi:SAM-dependent methyltransferase
MSDVETEGISQCFDKCACARGGRARPGSVRGVSRALLELLEQRQIAGGTMLELGCGLGGLTLESVVLGATHADGVDLSPVTIREASRLAAEAGLADRVTFSVGDGSREDLSPHDVVVLDKVICCYPEVDALIDNSVRAARATYGVVVPFSSGWRGVLARTAIGVENTIRRLKGQSFRAFVHDVGEIEARIERAGLARVSTARRLMWYVAVYARRASA